MDAKLWFTIISGLIGGVGMFLFGMTMMSNGLQKTAGESLKKILEKLTSNRVIGALVGVVVTVLLQSSTATTVMVVGFVNAGLMNLLQALSVILGANVGTTVTAQIIAFNVKTVALPAIGLGALIYVFVKNERAKYISEIILGFGLLFYGMTIMTGAFAPMQNDPIFSDIFSKLSTPILAVLVGTITTIILQSSAAVIGITIALATNGLIDFPTSVALVLGDNIGTTITANIAAIGGSRTAKQAAFGHFLFNFFGVCYMLIILPFFIEFVNMVTPGDPTFVAADNTRPYIARHIANAHSLFNVVNIMVFLPMLGVLAKICEKIIKTDEKQSYQFTQLSDVMLMTPETGVAQAKREVVKMANTTMTMLKATEAAVHKWDKKEMGKIEDYEQELDGFNKELLTFLSKIENKPLSEKTVHLISNLRQVIQSLEDIGDQTQKLMKITIKMLNKNQTLSDDALKELDTMFETVLFFAARTFSAFAAGRVQSEGELGIEDEIDRMHKQFRKNHIKRLNKGECQIDIGFSFVDVLGYLEKIGDYIFNVAQVNLRRNVMEK